PITYPTALSGLQLNATATYSSISVAGTFVYTPVSGTILNAGTRTLTVNFTPSDTATYNVVTGTTVSIIINKAVATITIAPASLTQVADGSPKPITVTTSPAGLTIITTTYAGSITVPSAIGSYPVSSSLANLNYTATTATGTLTITAVTGAVSITNL